MRDPNELVSFDKTIAQRVAVSRPETTRHLEQLIASSPRAIARGAGLSYSAASFGIDSRVIDMTRFDRVLDFESETGQVTVEPGISVGALTEFLAQKARYLPALPGYPSITVGGCLAFDIHGKSQAHSGNFSRWVESFVLQHIDQGILHCSREREREIFELTLGGLGLTGIVTRVVLNTRPLPSTCIQVDAITVSDLYAAADLLYQQAQLSHSAYSWNDLNQPGKHFGRGVVYTERFLPERQMSYALLAQRRVTTPLPARGWNGWTTRPALAAYGMLARRSSQVQLPLQRAMFPIYGKEYYYALFGPRGFREYQVIIPRERFQAFGAGLQQLLEISNVPATLGSLKVFAGEQNYVGFCGQGIALALDVPATARSLTLFTELDDLVVLHHGVINLSKDSRASRGLCERVFPGYREFHQGLRRFDPRRRYASTLSAQIGL